MIDLFILVTSYYNSLMVYHIEFNKAITLDDDGSHPSTLKQKSEISVAQKEANSNNRLKMSSYSWAQHQRSASPRRFSDNLPQSERIQCTKL